MVDLNGASSSGLRKPGHNAVGHLDRPHSPSNGKLGVFISYSRDDLNFADQLDAALQAYGFECLIDRHGISGGEDWKRRLGTLISEADTVVFLLSPSSARSEICAWEVDEAIRLGKRILPVICRGLEGASPPPRLQNLNYIFFHPEPKIVPGAGFGTGLASLIAALNTDFEWLREHTRYLQRAIEWDAGGRPANRLLSGNDIPEAKAWAARRPPTAPEPTALHLDFIRVSEEEAETRASEQRKQLEVMAAAQSEREAALQKAEAALKQAADAQRRRVRIRNIALVAVSILAVVAVLLGWSAERKSEQLNAVLTGALNVMADLQTRMDDDTKKEAFALTQTGADIGDATSMRNLGWFYEYGHGVPQDYAKARVWYEKAAKKGEAKAMANLGELYGKGLGVAQDYVKARAWFEKAAAEGGARGMADLGILYENGFGVAQDYVKAREWYEKAADEDARAMTNLGMLYHMGQGVTQNYAKAREWYEKAANKDAPEAMWGLGLLYDNGHGVKQDYVKAREWYEKAADKGIAPAMTGLGVLYAKGHGVAEDAVKAREWFDKAANTGDARGMANLGMLYENGFGAAQDYTKAREWYQKAADKGDAIAMARLKKLRVSVATEAGRYAEALNLQEALALEAEAAETKRDGKPGAETAQALNEVAWCALLAREFTKALTTADRAHTLLPNDVSVEIERAYALMFLDRREESRALYFAYRDKPMSNEASKTWGRAIAEDFAEFRKAGLSHPMMAEVERDMGISH